MEVLGGWRVKEVDLDLELCGGYILSTLVVSTLVVICVAMWCWRGGAVAWIYGDCLGEWMRKKMKSKTRCSWLLCCSVALLLLLPCTVNKNRSHVAAYVAVTIMPKPGKGDRIGESSENPSIGQVHHYVASIIP
jgi:hypothetical protein